jgi:hypothetical protein
MRRVPVTSFSFNPRPSGRTSDAGLFWLVSIQFFAVSICAHPEGQAMWTQISQQIYSRIEVSIHAPPHQRGERIDKS